MSTRTSYTQGTPNWTDLTFMDAEKTKTFYSALFGWEYEHIPTDQGSDYIMAKKKGLNAAGMWQSSDPEAMPPLWSVYLAVDDVDASANTAQQAGAQVMVQPMNAMDSGRMAVIADPAGAFIGLWQANTHIGASIVNEPGAFTWAEIFSPDTDKVLDFYEHLGLKGHELEMGDEPYMSLKAGDNVVGGTMKPYAPEVPPHWHAYFGVEDCDAAIETVKEKGGSVLNGPVNTPVGRMAIIADPDGAAFSIIAMPEWN